jgi:hypothetical protein
MKYIAFIAALLTFGVVVFVSCAKYKDPKGYTDPALTNPYCNDPRAVNYNVGFPGKPDNTLCFYPRDLFVGKWLFHDSVYLSSGLFIYADSFIINIASIPTDTTFSKILASGFCGGVNLSLTASPTYVATVDTISPYRDTLTLGNGQQLCRVQDTVNGTFTKSFVDSTLITISLQVISDTGITTHVGSARKQ